ncbi:MAG: glycosyltransferase [Candidatus Paceibacterota bacterium]
MDRTVLSIVIPCLDAADRTISCVKSIVKYTYTPYEILLIDNGSTNKNKEKMCSYFESTGKIVKFVKMNKNVGFTKAVNIGIRESEGDYVAMMHNDVEVSFRWDKKLINGLLDYKVGAVGPITQLPVSMQSPENLHRFYKANVPKFMHSNEFYGKKLDQLLSKTYIDMCKKPLSLFCVVTRKNVLEHVGLLDEDFEHDTGAECEFNHRLLVNGYKCLVSAGTFVFHASGITKKALKLNQDSIRRKSLEILTKKKVPLRE